MKRKRIVIALVLLLVAGGGFLLGRSTKPGHGDSQSSAESAPTSGQVYTCSMHPQVRLDRPGKCPICEMPLIPAASASSGSGGEPIDRKSVV